MAIKFVPPASQIFPATPPITKIYTTAHRSALQIHLWKKNVRFGDLCMPNHITKASEQSFPIVRDNKEIQDLELGDRTVSHIKNDLYQELQGINRGIFGIKSEKKSQIHVLVELLESQNPTPDPALNLDKVAGCWKLLYTITILGSKRTKLGLRDLISLGDLFQSIDVTKGKAVNVVKFNVRGLNMLNGQLTIEASFKISSNSRVEINYDSSTITPDQLMNMFQKNYDLLLGIFNPEGWLEITYVDEDLRIGRDDKGNIFVLERSGNIDES